MHEHFYYVDTGDFVDVLAVSPSPSHERCVACGRPTLSQPERIEIPADSELPLGLGILEGVGLAISVPLEEAVLREAAGFATTQPLFLPDGTESGIRQLIVTQSLELDSASFFPHPTCPACGSGVGLQETRMVLKESATLPPLARAGASRFHLLVREDVLARLTKLVPELPTWQTYWVGEGLPEKTFEGVEFSDIERESEA